jgi:hypothetical protein
LQPANQINSKQDEMKVLSFSDNDANLGFDVSILSPFMFKAKEKIRNMNKEIIQLHNNIKQMKIRRMSDSSRLADPRENPLLHRALLDILKLKNEIQELKANKKLVDQCLNLKSDVNSSCLRVHENLI